MERMTSPKDRRRDRLAGRAAGFRHGFTLVELLVVMAIISLLAGLLLPALETAVEQARTMQCASTVRNHAFAFFQYAEENDGYLCGSGQPSSVKGSECWCWMIKVAPYFEIPAGLHSYFPDANPHQLVQVYACPADPTDPFNDPLYKLSYGTNGGWGVWKPDYSIVYGPFGENPQGNENQWHKLESIPAPSRTVLFGDAWKNGKALNRNDNYYIGLSWNQYQNLTLQLGHGDGTVANLAYVDGAVHARRPLAMTYGDFTVNPKDE